MVNAENSRKSPKGVARVHRAAALELLTNGLTKTHA